MRAMDLVQRQSTCPTHGRPGVQYPIPQKKKGRGKKGARERLGMNPELRKVNLLLQNKTKQIWRNCDCEVHAPYREPSIIFIKVYSVKLSSKHLSLYPKFTQAFSPHHRTSFLQSMAINKEWVALESSILNETPVSHSSHSAGSTVEEELELPLKQMLRRSQRLWLPEKDLVKTSPGQSPAQKRKGYRTYIKMKISSIKDCWVEWPTRLPVIQSVAYTLAHRKALNPGLSGLWKEDVSWEAVMAMEGLGRAGVGIIIHCMRVWNSKSNNNSDNKSNEWKRISQNWKTAISILHNVIYSDKSHWNTIRSQRVERECTYLLGLRESRK